MSETIALKPGTSISNLDHVQLETQNLLYLCIHEVLFFCFITKDTVCETMDIPAFYPLGVWISRDSCASQF